jgi:5-methylcytosine-specific restriction protein A
MSDEDVSRTRAHADERSMGVVNIDAFRRALRKKLSESKGDSVVVTSRELHCLVGGYPSRNHRMPTCCRAMREAMQLGDRETEGPSKGNGATLTIRYLLPR